MKKIILIAFFICSHIFAKTHMGRIEISTADHLDGSSKIYYKLKTHNGKIINLKISPSLQQQLTADAEVTIEGQEGLDEFVVNEMTSLSAPETSSLVGSVLRTKRVAVLLVNFLDYTTQTYTKDQVKDTYFRNPTSTKKYWEENSFNTLTMQGIENPQEGGDVFGYYTVNYNRTGTCSIDAWATDAMAQATAQGHVMSQYTTVILLVAGAQNCTFGGFAEHGDINTDTQKRIWVLSNNSGLLAHELGHTLGLWHANEQRCTHIDTGVRLPDSTECTQFEYGDPYDVMGNGYKHVNIFHKLKLGFITEAQFPIVNQTGSYTIGSTAIVHGNLYGLRIPTVNPNEFFFLEYRRPFGFDNFSATAGVANGILIRKVYNPYLNGDYTTSYLYHMNPTNTALDWALSSGKTFSEHGNLFSVTTTSAGGSTASVNINLPISTSSDNTAPSSTSLDLRIENLMTNSVRLTWPAATDNVGVAHYNIYQAGSLHSTTAKTNVLITHPASIISYAYSVRAVDGSGNLAPTSTTVITTAPTTPVMSATVISSTQIQLTWTAATDADGIAGYILFKNGPKFTSVNSPTLTYTVSNLSPNTPYRFKTQAVDVTGRNSSYSNEVNVTTLATAADTQAPTTPSLSAAMAQSTSSVSLNWTPSTDNVGVTGYKVFKDGVFLTNATGTTTTISNLSPATSYLFKLQAYDAAGNVSSFSNQLQVTTQSNVDTQAPTIPIISGMAVSTSQINLTWTASTDNVGVTGYKIYKDGTVFLTTTQLSTSVTGLATATAYRFKVQAMDAAGNISGTGTEITITTLNNSSSDIQAPSAPTLSGTAVSPTQINLSWTTSTDNVGVTGYKLYRNGIEIFTLTGTTASISGLRAATTYRFKVRAFDAAGNISIVRNELVITTPSN